MMRIQYTISFFSSSFLHEKYGFDDWVHLMHVGADPHNPHTDGGDDHRNNAHSTSHCIYF